MKMRPSSFSKRLRFLFAANGSRNLSGRPVRPRGAHLVVRDVHLVVRDVHLVVRDDQSVSRGATAGIDLLVEIARIVVKNARIVVTVRADQSVRLGASAARARRVTARVAQDHA
jgi:hypothetical protein